jgi:ABC-type sugar transport system permease subunit
MKFLLLLPGLIFYLIFTAWPLIEVVRLSLYKTNFITTRFVWLDNYIASFKDAEFIQSIINSLGYAMFMVGGIFISLFIALYLYRLSKRWQDTSRIVLYLPSLAAGVIISMSWKWIFHSSGIANWLISLIGIPPINWFGSTLTAIPVLSGIVAFSGIGSTVIILLAVVQSVPKDYIDAARIDGASWGQIKRKIIIPIIAPTLYMLIIGAVLAALAIFEIIYMLAPYPYSATITFSIFLQGFQYSKYGAASAQSVILLLVAVLLYKLRKRWER